MLYIAQFFLPDTSEFRTLQQFFPDKFYQFDTRRRGNKVFPFLTYIMATEQRLDDGSAGGRAPYAVFLHGITQFVIIHKLACRLHSTQQCGFGVWFWRLGPLLRQ